jgi:hypothetical protein
VRGTLTRGTRSINRESIAYQVVRHIDARVAGNSCNRGRDTQDYSPVGQVAAGARRQMRAKAGAVLIYECGHLRQRPTLLVINLRTTKNTQPTAANVQREKFTGTEETFKYHLFSNESNRPVERILFFEPEYSGPLLHITLGQHILIHK